MNARYLFAAASITALGLAAMAGAIATADGPGDEKPAEKSEQKLPPGWTAADMEAFMLAATPGKMHERLAREVGSWRGKNTMWCGPDSEPTTIDCTNTIAALLDGRFTKCEMAGEIPGMGPYSGLAITGYDNVSKKFVCSWIDNFGTGMALGEGDLSADGKVLTWNFTFNCPIQKKPVVMRQVETDTGKDSKTVESFGPDPKTGKEFKMMRIELVKRK